MGIPTQASREILHRNPFPVGDPRHPEGGAEVLEALLVGTDLEGFAGDRTLLGRAMATLAKDPDWGGVTVEEAYRLRSADRVEALFLRTTENPCGIAGMPGRYAVGVVHAVEVTRADELAFRTSPSWRRLGGRGWILFDPGQVEAFARSAGREALAAAQERALEAGLALGRTACRCAAAFGPRAVEVALALRATSLPRSVRERAGERLPPTATLADVVVSLADVAASCDREEGETYARAAGHLLVRAEAILSAVGAGPSA